MKVYVVMKAMYDDFEVYMVTMDKAEAEAVEKEMNSNKNRNYDYFVTEKELGKRTEDPFGNY